MSNLSGFASGIVNVADDEDGISGWSSTPSSSSCTSRASTHAPSSMGSLHSAESDDSSDGPDEEIYGTFEEAQRRDPASRPPSGDIMGVERPGVSELATMGSVYEVPRHTKNRAMARVIAKAPPASTSAFRAKLTPMKESDALRAAKIQQQLAKKYGLIVP
jgi:hypothetical protein